MNRIFRIVWSVSRGQSVVASEAARTCDKHASRPGVVGTTSATVDVGASFSGRSFTYSALTTTLILLGLSALQPGFAAKDADLSGTGDGLTVGDDTSASDDGLTTLYWSNPNVDDPGIPIDYSGGLTVPGAVAIGTNAEASSSGSVVLGASSIAEAPENNQGASTVLGAYSYAGSNNNVVLGNRGVATGWAAMAVGRESASLGRNAIAFGNVSSALGDGAVAMGQSSLATGERAIAIGSADSDRDYTTDNTQALGIDSLAFGTRALADQQDATAFGREAVASGAQAVAIGTSSNASADQAVAIGNATQADLNATAIGGNATSTGESSVAIGVSSGAQGNNSLAVGNQAASSGVDSLAMGSGASSSAQSAMAIGDNAQASGDNAFSAGSGSLASGLDSLAMGTGAVASGEQSISIGYQNEVSGAHSGAIGDPNTINGTESYALGNNNTIDADFAGVFGNDNTLQVDADGSRIIGNDNDVDVADAFVMGNGADVTEAEGVALGNGSLADTGVGIQGYNPTTGAADGLDAAIAATESTTGAVAVGDADGGVFRQITGVAAGTEDSDAVNVAQLQASETHYYSVNDGGTQGGNYDNSGATGLNSLAAGVDAGADSEGAIALGFGATANNVNSVALGSGAVTAAPVGTASTTIGGTTYDFAGTAPVGTLSVGADGSERTITNVAAGRLSADSTDAINGSQLFATNQAVEDVTDTANAGWDLTAQGGNETNVAPGDTVDLSNNDGNLVIGKNAADGPLEEVTFDLSDEVMIGDTTINDDGIDMGGDTITNVGDPVNGGDAVNLDYFDENRSHYYSVNDGGTQGGNYDNDGATGLNSLAAGVDAGASVEDAMAIGRGSQSDIIGGIALGSESVVNRATAPTDGVIPAGSAEITYNTNDQELLGAVSFGDTDSYRQITNVADGTQDQDAVTIRQLQGAIGSVTSTGTMYFHANSTAGDSLAVGAESIAVGPETIVNGDNGIGMGNGALVEATAPGGTAIGQDAYVSLPDALAIGTESEATGEQALALGAGASADEPSSVALGANSATDPAVGTSGITLNGTDYTFAGDEPVGTVSVGTAGSERTMTNVAAGRINENSTDAINGSQLHATNQAVETVESDVADLDDQAVQYDTNADGSVNYDSITLEGDDGTVITNVADGDVSETSSDAVNGSQLWDVQNQITNIEQGGSKYFKANSEAPDASAAGQESVAMGPESVAAGDSSVAAGDGAVANSEGGVALGAGSEANRAGMDGQQERFSNESVASTQGAVSVGSEGGERQITNVAGGTQDTDAVNVRQLESVQAGAVNYDRNEDGSVDYSQVTLGQEGSPTRVRNVADGVENSDAVNMGQMRELNQRFSQQIDGVYDRLDDVEDQANAGTASALAAASVPQAYLPGKSMVAVGSGTYNGESAVSVGASRLSDNGRWAVKFNATADTQENFGAAVGAGFHF